MSVGVSAFIFAMFLSALIAVVIYIVILFIGGMRRVCTRCSCYQDYNFCASCGNKTVRCKTLFYRCQCGKKIWTNLRNEVSGFCTRCGAQINKDC